MSATLLFGYDARIHKAEQARDDALRKQRALPTIRAIARVHGVSLDQVMSRSRVSSVRAARCHAMAVVRWSTDWSLPQIARLFNRMDHTTVLSAVRRWAQQLKREHGVI